jgi:acyl carrier protein
MDVTDFLRSLDEVLDQEPGTLRPDSRLDDFGWRSLAAVELRYRLAISRAVRR